MASARKIFESGDAAGAIAQLEAFEPKHDLVSAFPATLMGEKVPESEPVPGQHAGGETAHILRGARGEAPNLPARRNMLIAVGVFSVALVSAMLIYRPWESSPSPALNTSPASAELGLAPSNTAASAPAPVVAPPPLAPVATPTSLTDKAEPTQDDKDIVAAYDLINGNKLPEASTLGTRDVAKISNVRSFTPAEAVELPGSIRWAASWRLFPP